MGAREIVLGGLGGGGDVGLALMLVRACRIRIDRVVVVSFYRCRSERYPSLRVRGALIRAEPGSTGSPRIFEDKLPLLYPELAGHTYLVCARDPQPQILKALDWLVENYAPRLLLHTDIGGDALIMGHEDRKGSYKTDTTARAALARTSSKHGIPSLLAVACVGCEGGGGELDPAELAANLQYAAQNSILRATLILPRETLEVGYSLLRLAESGMLPLLLAALRGLEEAEIDMAYLHGKYKIKPWYKCTYILDNTAYCQHSPICNQLLKEKEDAPHRTTPPAPQRVEEPGTILETLCKDYLTNCR